MSRDTQSNESSDESLRLASDRRRTSTRGGRVKRTFATWVRTFAGFVPSRVGSAILVGTWLALTILFAFVGNVFLLTVVTAMRSSLGPATLSITVFGIFGTPALAMVLAQIVVARAVERIEPVLARERDPMPDGGRTRSCDPSGGGHCRTASCC